MRILDRYILKSVLGIFIGCLFTFIFLYVIIDLFSHLDNILRSHIGIAFLTRYYLANLPMIFVQVVPIACLLASLYTFAKLNRDNEVIAMRSSGLSVLEMTKTVVVFSILISIFVFWVNDRLVPISMSSIEKLKYEMENGSKKDKERAPETIKNFSMFGLKNRLFYANSFSPSTSTMEGIIILEHDEHQNVIKKISANKGEYKDGLWIFYQCYSYTYNADTVEPQYQEEEIMTITETPEDFLTQGQRPDCMNIAQLDNYIFKLSKSGANKVINNLKVDLYQRFAMPFTSIIITLLGIPFALMIRKRATGFSSLGISLMVSFLYYVLNAISIALGKQGFLIPILSVFLSHLIALIFSLSLISSIP